jgi:HPt (histidine-containing phosphotransfer) domain-containing protein
MPPAHSPAGLSRTETALLLDGDVLTHLFEELGEENTHALIAMFFDRLSDRRQRLHRAGEDGDLQLRTRELHSLRGAAGTLGLNGISRLAKHYEQEFAQAQGYPLEWLIQDLDELRERTGRSLAHWLDGRAERIGNG